MNSARLYVTLKSFPINTITHGPWADQPTDFIMPTTQFFEA